MNLSEAVKLAKKRKAEVLKLDPVFRPRDDHQALIALLDFVERQHKDLESWLELHPGGKTGKIAAEARAAGIGD